MLNNYDSDDEPLQRSRRQVANDDGLDHKHGEVISGSAQRRSLQEQITVLLRKSEDKDTSVEPTNNPMIFTGRSQRAMKCLSEKCHNTLHHLSTLVVGSDRMVVHHRCGKRIKLGHVVTEEIQFSRTPDGDPEPELKHGFFTGAVNDMCPHSWQDVTLEGVDRLEDECKPIVPKPETRCYCVMAGMAMGKTHQCREYLVKIFAENPSARVLIVSSRITLGLFQKGSFKHLNFVFYKDKVPDVYSSDRIIVQYQSLHKLVYKNLFDVIILDETRAVISNMCCSTTNKTSRLKTNADTLKLLMEKSKLVLCLDADLEWDTSVARFLKSCFADSEIELHRYVHQKIVRRLNVSDASGEFEQSISQDVGNGLKVGILCRTLKQAKKNVRMFCNASESDGPQYNRCKLVAITSESSKELIAEFTDIDKYLETKAIQCVVLTSKLTVGCDIQTKFDRLYVDFRGDDGCKARDILQMIGRFRQVSDASIAVLCDRNPMYLPNLLQKGEEYLAGRRKLFVEDFVPLIALKLLDDSQAFDWEVRYDEQKRTLIKRASKTPHWLAKLVLLDYAEQDQNQVYLLFAQARRKGWTVYVDARQSGKDAETEIAYEARSWVKDVDKVARKEIFEDLRLLDQTALGKTKRESEDKERQDLAEPATKKTRQIASILENYAHPPSFRTENNEQGIPVERKEVVPNELASFQEFEIAEKYCKQIVNFALFLPQNSGRFGPCSIVARDQRKLDVAEYSDLTIDMTYVRMESVQKALLLVGGDGVDAGKVGRQFPIQKFAQHEKEIVALMKKSRQAGAKRRDRCTGRKPGMKAIYALRHELEDIWGTTLEKVPKKRVYKYVLLHPLIEVLARKGSLLENYWQKYTPERQTQEVEPQRMQSLSLDDGPGDAFLAELIEEDV